MTSAYDLKHSKPRWEVVGGADKGGILVREGVELKSKQCEERLAHGAIIEELELVGERLNYKVVSANWGPDKGWVSLKIGGKDIVKRQGANEGGEVATLADGGGPADSSFAVDVDEDLKKRIEGRAKEMKDKDMLNLSAFKYKLLGGPLADPKMRIFCFHNAGSAESAFTTPSSDLWKWMKSTKAIEMIALDYPGRDKLLKDPFIPNTLDLAEWLLAIIHDKIADGVPYMIWGHSVGTWVAFELLSLARQIGLPMPKAAILNAFPAPHMPVAKRPWRRSKALSSAEMKKELLNWDEGHFTGAGKVVFDEPSWTTTWEPMMRADFQLYDEYEFKRDGAPKFDFTIHSWFMEGEKLNKPDMIEMWKDLTSGEFDNCVMKEMGHLTCFYKPDFKKIYYDKVMGLLKQYSGLS